MIKNKFLIVLFFIISYFSGIAQNENCAQMDPICTNAGLSFTANANVGFAEPGNNYDCLGSQPNPSWYYFEIATNGNIDMSLSANFDIDFIIWGPFVDLADAQADCGIMGTPGSEPVVDCSFSATNNETPSIPSAVAGEVYVLLITNYANSVQAVSLTQTGGTGSTDCSIIPPCNADPGSFTLLKNNQVVQGPINLCAGDDFEILSDDNFILPADTIDSPIGDGYYTAEVMFLIYSALPTGNDPAIDPGYTQILIPSDSLYDSHDNLSPIVSNLGCGTYYFVPVTGDDGIGANNNVAGTNDNGIVHWDTDANGCFVLGDPIEVTYSCPINPLVNINCTSLNNGLNIDFSQFGQYTILNTGMGDLIEDTVLFPQPAQLNNLSNNDAYALTIQNDLGCIEYVNGVYILPQFNNITIIPATDCPSNALGQVYVNGNLASGNGGLAQIIMNGFVETITVPFDTIAAPVGSLVQIQLIDGMGCHTDSNVTVNSFGHSIKINILSQTDVLCFGNDNGTATIDAYGINGAGIPDNIAINSIIWTSPQGITFPGGPSNLSLTNMIAGVWTVTVDDVNGCSNTISINIGNPQVLNLFVQSFSNPNCYNESNGSISVGFTGGTPGANTTYSWSHDQSLIFQAANLLPAGTYTSYVEDHNGCLDSVVFELINPLPIEANFSVKKVLCHGDSTGVISVLNVYNNGGPVTYEWDLPGFVDPPNTVLELDYLPAGGYSLIIIDSIGCSNSFDFTIDQNSDLIDTIVIKKAFCRTADFQSGNGVLAVSAIGGESPFTFLWENIETGESTNATTFNGLNPGIYTSTVTDNVGCTLVSEVVLDSINPEASFIPSSLNFHGPGEFEGTEELEIEFENTSINFSDPDYPLSDTTFKWNLFTNKDTEGEWFFSFDYNEKIDTSYTGEHVFDVCLVAKNFNDCVDTTCHEVIVHTTAVLEVPNVFTPGESPNEVFFFPSQGIQTFSCIFYDRYGIKVFEFSEITDQWDGSHFKSGKQCSDGVYFFRYNAVSTNGTSFEGDGSVTLINNK